MPPITSDAAQHPIEDLQRYHKNARRGDLDVIAESLQRLGQYRPIVVNRGSHTGRSNEVLAGNHTLQAAQRLGWDSIAVTWVDVDDDTAARIVLVDNKSNDAAGYDEAALADLLTDLPDLSGTGWTRDELDDLLDDLQDTDSGDESPDPPLDLPQADPISAVGDVWVLGKHRVVCGDSTDAATIERALGGAQADCLWTDPPYGVAYVGGTKDKLTLANDDLDADELLSLLTSSLSAAMAQLKPGCAWYVASPGGPLYLTFLRALDAIAAGVRQGLVWRKNTFALGRSDYHYQHEPIIYGWAAGLDAKPEAISAFRLEVEQLAAERGLEVDLDGVLAVGYDDGHDAIVYGWRPGASHRWFGGRKKTSVIDADKPPANRDHPTMKPLHLIRQCLENSTRRGDLVLDIFGGSGSTLMAAETSGRRAALVELDPRYVDVICRRWQKHARQMPVLEATGSARDFLEAE